jgi:hypothetical protein
METCVVQTSVGFLQVSAPTSGDIDEEVRYCFERGVRLS